MANTQGCYPIMYVELHKVNTNDKQIEIIMKSMCKQND